MPHASNIVYCDGPESPHAFDVVPLQPRNGGLDAMCPVCKGRGQWYTRSISSASGVSGWHAIGAMVRDGWKPEPIRSACPTSKFRRRGIPVGRSASNPVTRRWRLIRLSRLWQIRRLARRISSRSVEKSPCASETPGPVPSFAPPDTGAAMTGRRRSCRSTTARDRPVAGS